MSAKRSCHRPNPSALAERLLLRMLAKMRRRRGGDCEQRPIFLGRRIPRIGRPAGYPSPFGRSAASLPTMLRNSRGKQAGRAIELRHLMPPDRPGPHDRHLVTGQPALAFRGCEIGLWRVVLGHVSALCFVPRLLRRLVSEVAHVGPNRGVRALSADLTESATEGRRFAFPGSGARHEGFMVFHQ